ncbi:hypothetical protein ACFOSC_29760 [Streptantibioticus rubrisoli]|uniref:Lipoprotein n=1 Tax=Streptantibioticus rubrisoli TaxID=1387313 RepID=A0ABT1PFX6_9ACTN|nr:hypothetical protein [Streptantibioticus rubrisoli]MCQ4044267.1 hypothetical protein [Streptantibioticus rubrisoli]
MAVAVIAALGTVSACGGGKSSTGAKQSGAPSAGQQPVVGSAISALLKVKSSTDQAKSAKVDEDSTMGAMGTMHFSGALDWSDGMQGDLLLTSSGSSSLAGAMGITEYRYAKDAMYSHFGDQMAQSMGGKHWMKYSYDQLDKQGPAGKAMHQQINNGNPNQTVEMLIASGDVKVVGKENVKGVDATHYSGTVDVAKLTTQTTPGLSQADQDQLKQQMSAAGITTDQIDIWVNGDNLMVKKTEQMHSAKGEIKQTVYYSDYGTTVTVTPPPAADTTDASAALSGGMPKQG